MSIKSITAALCVSLLAATSGTAATLASQFTFDSGLTDNNAGATATGAGTGAGTVAGGRYTFAKGEGLQVTMGSSLASYSIVLGVEFDSFNTYTRILDVSGLTSDNGVYVHNTGLRYFNAAGGSGPSGAFSTNTDAIFALTFNGTTTTGYVDGSQAFSFVQSGTGYFDTLSVFTLFADGNPNQNEESAGSLDFLEVYNGVLSAGEVAAYTPPGSVSAVPLPAGGVLLLTGLVGVVSFKRRKKRDNAPEILSN